MFQHAKTWLAVATIAVGLSGCCNYGGGCGGSCGMNGGSCGGGYDCGGDACGCGDHSGWWPWNWSIFHPESWACSQCGETYWGDHDSCDCKCDRCGNYAGYAQPGVGYQQPYMSGEYAGMHPRRGSYQNQDEMSGPGPEPMVARQPRMTKQSAYVQPPDNYGPTNDRPQAPQYAQRQPTSVMQQPTRAKRPVPVESRAGSRDDVDDTAQAPRPAKMRPYPEQPTSGTQDTRRVNRASYEEAPRTSSARPTTSNDPWAWMYAE
ncbi:MAG TPA: hypothetical protein VFE24_13965 [Pirellulales bacterium]|jgi:hypothetical protein|nr:hypothetical protein [Pirellulales bacterium]